MVEKHNTDKKLLLVKFIMNQKFDSKSMQWTKIIFLLCATTVFLIIRYQFHAFNISLRYFYMILIGFSAFWFGLKGGLIMATISMGIFFGEITVFTYFANRSIVLENILIRVWMYYFSAIIIGALSDRERKLKETLKELAYRDELTGCLNYRFIIELFKREISQSKRNNKEMIVIMLDLDNFKTVNDHFGHMMGNEVLKWFANILKISVRNLDIVGRYGGDEFLLILPECSLPQAVSILGRIKNNIENQNLQPQHLKEQTYKNLKFSAGIAAFPANGNNIYELIHAADKSLFQAKNSGRDRIMIERRKGIRIEPDLELTFEVLSEVWKEVNKNIRLNNISKEGISILTTKNMSDDEFKGRIHHPHWNKPEEIFCKVVRKKTKYDNVYELGIMFKDLSPEGNEKISKLIYH